MSKWEELNIYLPPTSDPNEIQKRTEQDLTFTYLGALDPSYEAIRSQILASAEMPSFDDVVARIKQEQSRRSLMNPPQAETTENQAFKTLHTPNPNPRGPTKTKGVVAADWCDHYKCAGHNREGCWVLHPHLRPVRNKGGWGGGKFSGLNKRSEWGNERIEATEPSESINPRGHPGRFEHRAEPSESINPRGHPGEGLSVAPTAQLAQLMSQLSSLLQQHAAGSAKSFNFCGIFKLLEKYGPNFANFCQNKNK
jgi:hypothetical protein